MLIDKVSVSRNKEDLGKMLISWHPELHGEVISIFNHIKLVLFHFYMCMPLFVKICSEIFVRTFMLEKNQTYMPACTAINWF